MSVQGSPSISAQGLDFPNKESPAHPAESSVDELIPGTEELPELDIEIAPSVYQDEPEDNTAIPSAGLDQLPEVPFGVHLEITENPQEPVSISDEEVPVGVSVADSSLQGRLDIEDAPATVAIENREGEHENEDTTEPADVVNAVGAEEIRSEIGAEDSMNLSINTTEIDRPKSPWTPSYSVINQGPDMAREEDIPEIQQLPPSSVPAGQELPVPEVNIIPEVSEATVANVSPMIYGAGMLLRRAICSLKNQKNRLDHRRLGFHRIPCLFKEVLLFLPTPALYWPPPNFPRM